MKINYKGLIIGVVHIFIGIFILRGDFNEVELTSITIKIIGITTIIAGLLRIYISLYKTKYAFDGDLYCFADDLGIYGKLTNTGFMFLAFVNLGILLFVDIKDIVSAVIPAFAAMLLNSMDNLWNSI